MHEESTQDRRLTEEGILEDLQRQPHLLMKLAENALTVAESLRDNYFKNTTRFVKHLRGAIDATVRGKRSEPILTIHKIENANWLTVQGEVVTFIDGGVGEIEISSQVPIFLRVGSYRVRTGERHLAEREQFGYYPVILGDLEGGSKDRGDFLAVVRTIAELLGGLSALVRNPDLNVLMFHGPLVYVMGGFSGHTPFTETDIDLFLRSYAPDPKLCHQLKEDFLQEAKLDIYPKMTERSDEWIKRRLFEPLAWIAYLYRRLIQEARQRKPIPLVAGVVERGRLREFIEKILLERVFRGLRDNEKMDYFNQMYGRSDLTSPTALLDRLGYTDALLLAMLLQSSEYSESWEINKYGGLHRGRISLPGEAWKSDADWGCLRPPSPVGFPRVRGCYIHVSETTEPIRLEVFDELGPDQVVEAARRTYLYARLLPGYGFPVGLDIADKYAHVPVWLTDAYSKLIRYHLGVSLQRGEITDTDMRRILVQAIYMQHRDWLFRPKV